MRNGYTAEMEGHEVSINLAKAKLEEFYAARHEDKNIVADLKDTYDSLISNADAAMGSFATGSRIVKSVLATWSTISVYGCGWLHKLSKLACLMVCHTI